MISFENMNGSNIVQIKQYIFRRIYVYIYMYIISNEKDFMNFKERNEVYMVGFKGNKGSKK